MNNKTVFPFSEAYQLFLSQGVPIKRVGWLGYWVLEDGDVVMYCKNGDVVHLGKGCDPSFTLLSNMFAADEWMPVDDDLRKELDTIRESRVLVNETAGA